MTHYTLANIPKSFIETIFQALGELPLKQSGPVFSLIQGQVTEQDKSPPQDPS